MPSRRILTAGGPRLRNGSCGRSKPSRRLTLLANLHRILTQLVVIFVWLGVAFRGVWLISVDWSRGPWGVPTRSRLRPGSTPQTAPASDGAAPLDVHPSAPLLEAAIEIATSTGRTVYDSLIRCSGRAIARPGGDGRRETLQLAQERPSGTTHPLDSGRLRRASHRRGHWELKRDEAGR